MPSTGNCGGFRSLNKIRRDVNRMIDAAEPMFYLPKVMSSLSKPTPGKWTGSDDSISESGVSGLQCGRDLVLPFLLPKCSSFGSDEARRTRPEKTT